MLTALAFVRWDLAPYMLADFLAAYLLGSIPFGLIFTWLSGAGDVRKIGSGNIGATNVLRTGKKWAAAATLLCDGAKGAAAVLLARHYLGEIFGILAGLGAFLGHIFPIWLRFRGGKGVATFLGVMLALSFPIGLLACASWVIVARTVHVSSLAALVAAAATPLYFLLWGTFLYAFFALLLTILIFYTHRGNIARLWTGREPRIGAS